MKRRSLIHPWSSIIVYIDDEKSIKEYKLNEEQRLIIPLKSMRRKHNQKSDSKCQEEKKNDSNDKIIDKTIDNKLHLEYAHQEIFSIQDCQSGIFNEAMKLLNFECLSDSCNDCNDNIYGL